MKNVWWALTPTAANPNLAARAVSAANLAESAWPVLMTTAKNPTGAKSPVNAPTRTKIAMRPRTKTAKSLRNAGKKADVLPIKGFAWKSRMYVNNGRQLHDPRRTGERLSDAMLLPTIDGVL